MMSVCNLHHAMTQRPRLIVSVQRSQYSKVSDAIGSSMNRPPNVSTVTDTGFGFLHSQRFTA